MNTKIWKRMMAGLLAGVLIFTGIPFSASAGEPPVQMIIRGDAFQNRQINIFGHSHRSITCYYVNPVEGHVPAFCLQPGKKLPNHTQASWERYSASPETSVPVIGSFDRYLPMTLAYEWMVSGNYYDKTRYAMVQTYFWGCLAGFEQDWDIQEETMKKLEWAIRDGRVLSLFHEMRSVVEKGLEEYESNSGSSLPAWNGRKENMILKDGHYELTLDLSSCPQLKNANWQFPDKNWSFTQGPGENEITFLYTGEEPSGRISAGNVEGLDDRYYAYIFYPGESYQMQMGWLDMQRPQAEVWFETGKGSVQGGQMQPLERFRHREVFEADYKIDLEKYCAETGQPLAGADFQVWESFDHSQINEHGYEEGEPDGTTGQVYSNCMSPEPEEEWLCDVITTDEEGKAFHKDIRNYNYSKTYCMGHPAPEWIECDHEGDGGDGEDGEGEEEECNCEEENERLREQWLEEQELCEASSDFHVSNEDEEDHEQSTEAMEAMLEDRDETYENFIALEYGYTLTEKKARTGYMVHGTHREDFEIEKITVASAQAQRNTAGKEGTGREDPQSEVYLGENTQLQFHPAPQKKEKKNGYAYETGAQEERSAEELRTIHEVKLTEDIYEEEEDDEDEIWDDRATESNAKISRTTANTATESKATASDAAEDNAVVAAATASNAKKDLETTEQYIYTREEISLEPISLWESLRENVWNSVKAIFFSSEDDDDFEGITAFLPDFQDDDLGEMDVSCFGDPSNSLYCFKVWDHRTEGRIYINKRDLHLYEKDQEESYGRTQGDGTLEGAVYGLFAAADIVHPDGRSGVIYQKDDLTAVAATDQDGNASFFAYTEVPHTVVKEDGTIEAPENFQGPETLYNGSTINSSDHGFGSYTYPDRKEENGNSWIGRPLLMGSYYVKELSRSEGYELSVTGKNLVETNRGSGEENVVRKAGQVQVSAGLSEHNSMEADGSWNDFTVEAFGTEKGYEITVSGYPENTKFYRLSSQEQRENLKQITGMEKIPKMDHLGNPVYEKAKGGELKRDLNGNPVLKADAGEDEKVPASETVPYHFRTAPYIKGEAKPEDLSKWDEDLDPDYVMEQAQAMLMQLGYKEADGEGAPWVSINLDSMNGKAVEQILDWYTEHSFYNMAAVSEIKEEEGQWQAKLFYDYSGNTEAGSAVYDRADGQLYVKKERENGHYWICIPKGKFRLSSHTAYIKEKWEYVEDELKLIYEPVYERYEEGEVLLDPNGVPIQEMEQVPIFEERETTYVTTKEEPVEAFWDPEKREYHILVENETDWSVEKEEVEETFRAVTGQTTISVNGKEVPYNQYLVSMGAAVDVEAEQEETDPGSFVKYVHLAYPGQNQTVQDGGTEKEPVQVLERAIRQPVRITKHISQSSYENVNTYGSVHNDPVTTFLGLFRKNGSAEGRKLLDQFSFRIYLKQNLLNIYVDDEGKILSEDISSPAYKELVQTIYLPPEDAENRGHQLMERNEDGSCNYRKFFDAMEGAEKKKGGIYPKEVLTQFALDHYDIRSYKEEILKDRPYMDSDRAYKQALDQARKEAARYLDQFTGLKERLSIEWERDANGGTDGNRKTIQCNQRNGKDDYYEYSIPLPYGEYVIEEQMPSDLEKELANRHYKIEEPREITLPFVPEIIRNEDTGKETVLDETGSAYFRYHSSDSPDELIRKYKIRFNEEDRKILADGIDGSFAIYPYGLDKDILPEYSTGTISQSEDHVILDGVIYDGSERENGQMEICDQVPGMKGKNTAIEGKFAPMLVPWSILTPEYDRINPDTGNIETLQPGGSGAGFNYIAFAQEDFENTYFNSRLRIEKIDSETGENLIHEGALFRIYAAKRDAQKNGINSVTGTGQVLFGPAEDAEGNKVVDADGKEILYPRVGQDNGSQDDLPVKLDQDGVPLYDETQRISQVDETGTERGIFRSFTTLREVLIHGKLEKLPVGYIETPRPLGAGAYVLVEVQAPEGYVKSRPVAFEVYGNEVSYYKENVYRDGTTDGYERKTAANYEYAIPVTGDGNKNAYETVSQIPVENHPSVMRIRKVEDGDSLVGNENGLLKTDALGQEETSGGLEEDIWVNDRGDEIIYQVYGRKEKLEERGDVREIHFDRELGTWTGKVTKKMDFCSEEIIEGTEKELKAMEGVKLLYDRKGEFTGKGIRFKVTVSGATLALYQGLWMEKEEDGSYKGVTAEVQDGKTIKITASETGSRRQILETGKDAGPAGLAIWQDEKVENQPEDLYFYDLDQLNEEGRLERTEDKSVYKVLDERGNFICYADVKTGMAFVYDDHERIMAYIADETGEKKLVYSVQVYKDKNGESVYKEKRSVDDENGLPVYDKQGHFTTKEERWTSDNSTDSKGEAERRGGLHEIKRLPFGAYILQEEQVPFEQGYVQAPYQGILFKDSIEPQEYFHSNAFTRAAFAKVDTRTQEEIKGAVMTFYEAATDEAGRILTDEDGIYLPGKKYASWVSGYACDDQGNVKTDEEGNRIETKKPHWIDHIPVGEYVLEETECPYLQGYVQRKRQNIQILETEHVQSFTMEDDFTAAEIRKEDGKTGELLYEDSLAKLVLYQVPEGEEDKPLADLMGEDNKLLDFERAGFKEWMEIWATGREEADAAGLNPIAKYDHRWENVPGTLKGRYCFTEEGTVRFEYLPVGSYILAEKETPSGYATADPILFEITDTGHLEKIHQVVMKDEPLSLVVSKNTITGGKEVAGAKLGIYPVDEEGTVSEKPLLLHIPEEEGRYRDEEAIWFSGTDGVYTEEENENGELPEGFEVGDLKPHLIEYIPVGSYILREEMTPYGFLQSVDIPFVIEDTREIQKKEMQDEIPEGGLTVIKHDADDADQVLEGAEFELFNQTLDISCEKQVTDEKGKAQFSSQPIGYLDQEGKFSPYDYLVKETKAAPGHMLSEKTLEFQFEYKDEKTPLIELTYDPVNDSNRVLVKKLLRDTEEYLEGAVLRLEREEKVILEPDERGDQGESQKKDQKKYQAKDQMKEEKTWVVVETWITGKQSHLIKGLAAGDYRLVEEKAPTGFTKSEEPVYFTITDGMTEIPEITLRNYGTIISVEKREASSEKLLSGAKLELVCKDTMEVISQWISDQENGQVFNGLEPGTYIIREIEAPAGYEKGKEMEIRILDQAETVQEFVFYNSRIRSSGGGGSHTVPKKLYISFKKTDEKGEPLAGAVFAFYDQTGRLAKIAESGPDGMFKIICPPNGTYIFKEIKAPDGYELSQELYHFTVEKDQNVKGVFQIKNEKIQKKTKGRIQAFYQVKGRNGNFKGLNGKYSGSSVKTGDNSQIGWILLVTCVCLSGAGWCFSDSSRKRKKMVLFLGLVMGAVSLFAFSAMAQEQDANLYDESFYASQEIIYKKMEGVDTVPETAWVQVKDRTTGRKTKRILPLEQFSRFNEHWEDGLEITIEQEKEFQNEITEAEILDEAGLPASDYEITQIEKGEDRKLVARGRKKVFDCRAVYSGLIAEKDWDREEMPDTDLKREWEQDVELKPAVTGSKFVGKMVLAVVTGSCVGIGAYWILKKGKLNKASLKIREKRRILGIILLTGAAAGIVYTGNTVRKYRLAAEKYESIRREVQKTETSYAQDHSGTSIDEITIEEAKLKEINPDYNCWIRIPGTSIDYPAVWGKDDKYYLDHGFNGEKQSGGTIFADSQNIPFVSANTIFYGHNMKDGSMFGDLKKYRDPGFLKEHPNVEIFYQGQWITCPIILAKVTDETDGTPYQKGERKILTLSTCYGTSKRMILQALIPVAGGMN